MTSLVSRTVVEAQESDASPARVRLRSDDDAKISAKRRGAMCVMVARPERNGGGGEAAAAPEV